MNLNPLTNDQQGEQNYEIKLCVFEQSFPRAGKFR